VGGVVAMLVISIILEAAVAILAILAAARKGAFFPASSCSQP
jgi:hypothetical protein